MIEHLVLLTIRFPGDILWIITHMSIVTILLFYSTAIKKMLVYDFCSNTVNFVHDTHIAGVYHGRIYIPYLRMYRGREQLHTLKHMCSFRQGIIPAGFSYIR